MTGPVLLDSNLLLLLVVGSADRKYIRMHKRLSDYGEDDFEVLIRLTGLFSEIVVTPHVIAELSNLSRQIANPARSAIQERLREFVEATQEVQIASVFGARRTEFPSLGATDSVLLHLCEDGFDDLRFTLLTADSRLAVRAKMLECDAFDFRDFRGA